MRNYVLLSTICILNFAPAPEGIGAASSSVVAPVSLTTADFTGVTTDFGPGLKNIRQVPAGSGSNVPMPPYAGDVDGTDASSTISINCFGKKLVLGTATAAACGLGVAGFLTYWFAFRHHSNVTDITNVYVENAEAVCHHYLAYGPNTIFHCHKNRSLFQASSVLSAATIAKFVNRTRTYAADGYKCHVQTHLCHVLTDLPLASCEIRYGEVTCDGMQATGIAGLQLTDAFTTSAAALDSVITRNPYGCFLFPTNISNTEDTKCYFVKELGSSEMLLDVADPFNATATLILGDGRGDRYLDKFIQLVNGSYIPNKDNLILEYSNRSFGYDRNYTVLGDFAGGIIMYYKNGICMANESENQCINSDTIVFVNTGLNYTNGLNLTAYPTEFLLAAHNVTDTTASAFCYAVNTNILGLLVSCYSSKIPTIPSSTACNSTELATIQSTGFGICTGTSGSTARRVWMEQSATSVLSYSCYVKKSTDLVCYLATPTFVSNNTAAVSHALGSSTLISQIDNGNMVQVTSPAAIQSAVNLFVQSTLTTKSVNQSALQVIQAITQTLLTNPILAKLLTPAAISGTLTESIVFLNTTNSSIGSCFTSAGCNVPTAPEFSAPVQLRSTGAYLLLGDYSMACYNTIPNANASAYFMCYARTLGSTGTAKSIYDVCTLAEIASSTGLSVFSCGSTALVNNDITSLGMHECYGSTGECYSLLNGPVASCKLVTNIVNAATSSPYDACGGIPVITALNSTMGTVLTFNDTIPHVLTKMNLIYACFGGVHNKSKNVLLTTLDCYKLHQMRSNVMLSWIATQNANYATIADSACMASNSCDQTYALNMISNRANGLLYVFNTLGLFGAQTTPDVAIVGTPVMSYNSTRGTLDCGSKGYNDDLRSICMGTFASCQRFNPANSYDSRLCVSDEPVIASRTATPTFTKVITLTNSSTGSITHSSSISDSHTSTRSDTLTKSKSDTSTRSDTLTKSKSDTFTKSKSDTLTESVTHTTPTIVAE